MLFDPCMSGRYQAATAELDGKIEPSTMDPRLFGTEVQMSHPEASYRQQLRTRAYRIATSCPARARLLVIRLAIVWRRP